MPFIDLFSQTLLFFMYLIVFVPLFYGYSHLHAAKAKDRAYLRKRLVIVLLGAIACSVGTWLVFCSLFVQDTVPVDGIVWVLPIFCAIGLIILGIKNKLLIGIGVFVTIASLILLGLITNNYFRYYPTLASVFQTDLATTPTQNLAASVPSISKNAVVLEQYYQALPDQPSHGQLLALNIPSSTSAFSPRQGIIYLPPALSQNPQIKLPVIVLLAGHPGSPIQWEQSGLQAIMDSFAAQHKGLAPIVAVVDFTGVKDLDTECVDSSLGSSETYLTKDVPTYLKQHYQVESDPADWAIGGYSAGGTCSTLITLRNPNVYRSFLNISGDAMPSLTTPSKTLSILFGGSQQQLDAHTPNLILKQQNPLLKELNGWYFYGRQDDAATIRRIQAQYNLAVSAGLNVTIHSMDGHHEFSVWKEGYVEALPWVSNLMQLTTYEKK